MLSLHFFAGRFRNFISRDDTILNNSLIIRRSDLNRRKFSLAQSSFGPEKRRISGRMYLIRRLKLQVSMYTDLDRATVDEGEARDEAVLLQEPPDVR